MRRPLILALLVLAALAAAAPATAAPGDPFQFKGFFDTSEISGGVVMGGDQTSMAVNEETGNVIVLERGRLHQFDAEGNPVDFAATGSPTIEGINGAQWLVIDNSGTASQGNIYVVDVIGCCNNGGERFWSFDADGNPFGTNPHEEVGTTFFGIRGAWVAPDGQLWLIGFDYSSQHPSLLPVEPEGPPAGPIVQFDFDPNANYYPFRQDGLGHVYLPNPDLEFHRFDFLDGYKDEGATGLSLFQGRPVVDPATNDVYQRGGGKLFRLPYTDPLVKGTRVEALGGIGPGEEPFAFDPTGQTVYIAEGTRISIFHREPAAAPWGLGTLGVDAIRTDRAALHGQFISGGAPTSYYFEYGTDTSYGNSTAPQSVPYSHFPVSVGGSVEGLQPNTTYHVRMVAVNAAGTTYGPDKTFLTYAFLPPGPDPCPNALARQQTGARYRPDCRAYELVSAKDTNGYDVESSLVPGQEPFPGFPEAKDRVLYGTHDGAISGPWNPTNKGPDPYLATRTDDGWVTEYRGLPADINPASGSFASQLGEASARLDSLAFVGPDLCSPCFSSGLETGIPVRRADGSLVQGMAGSLNPGVASARPEGEVAKYFSNDGRNLVFASKYAFEPGANTNGDLTVYERDIQAGVTEIVSTDDSGATLSGDVSELDVNDDGSRVIVGNELSSDGEGNVYIHPYLHRRGTAASVDLAPPTTTGVLYAGMTKDGSRVFFTTFDKLLGSDTDQSSDLYEAVVGETGGATLNLVGGSNSDACNPVGNDDRPHWNSADGTADCSVVAVGGGGGVSSASGTVWFLSPEQFGGEGTADQPNLYRANPGGTPSFVATLEPNNPLVLDSVSDASDRETADFQATANGGFAAFSSKLDLAGYETHGFSDVFQYSAAADRVACASCDRSGTTDLSLIADSFMPTDGRALLEDGRVFFTTRTPLALTDSNGRTDVYYWSDGKAELISAGTGAFDSGLLTASQDGTDVFFFTHDELAPEEDHLGPLTKIYDARVGGGFFKLPPEVPCAAADECHGAGTPIPPPPDIKSSGPTTRGNVLVCKKPKVKRHGKCVKKKKKTKKHHHKKRHNQGKQGKGKRHA
ncbi:MAG TPA: fibronectin type III domain-containing protein [Solirubrobacterales bacterium]|nr:fibronectin type III domain-containing protein [Solirubrobacterales bacterium]